METIVPTDDVHIVRGGPFLLAAGVSVATAVVLVAWLLVAAAVIGLIGCVLAFWASSHRRAVRASGLISVALGLGIGPALYIGLWAIVSAVS